MSRRPGSRRSREAALITPAHWHNGVPPGEEFVAVLYVCGRDHAEVEVGYFQMSTATGVGRDVTTRPMEDGSLPFQEHAGGVIVRLICTTCGVDVQIKPQAVEAELNAMWAPHARRVEVRRI